MALGKSEKIIKVIRTHSPGNVNVCTKCHGNPVAVEISLWNKNVSHDASREDEQQMYCIYL